MVTSAVLFPRVKHSFPLGGHFGHARDWSNLTTFNIDVRALGDTGALGTLYTVYMLHIRIVTTSHLDARPSRI